MGGKSSETTLTGPLAWCYDAAVTSTCWGYFILAFIFPFCVVYGGAWLLPGSRETRFQQINNLYYRGFFRLLQIITPRHQWRIDTQVKQIRSSVVVCNHLSYLDPLLMMALFPKQKTVVKTKFFKVPIFGWVLKNAGYFPADGKGKHTALMIKQIEGMKQYLAEGGVFFIFPEGSRSRNGNIGPLHTGALKIARLCNAPIHVLHLKGTDKLFTPGKFFFNARMPNTICLQSIDRIPADPHQSLGDLTEKIRGDMAPGTKQDVDQGQHTEHTD